MKRIVSLVLCLAMLLTTAALAEDLGVQVIGGPNVKAAPLSLDDMKLGESYIMDGYAVAAPKEFKIVDCFAQFGETGNYGVNQPHSWSGDPDNNTNIVYSYENSGFRRTDWRYNDASWMDSGSAADFVWFMMDVTNLQKESVDFTKKATVKVVYQDDYEFNGWIRQINFDNMEKVRSDGFISRFNQEKGTYPMNIVMNPAMIESVDMMYTSTFVFGCTLPTYVVADEESPLRMEIKLGENELTYHIRK